MGRRSHGAMFNAGVHATRQGRQHGRAIPHAADDEASPQQEEDKLKLFERATSQAMAVLPAKRRRLSQHRLACAPTTCIYAALTEHLVLRNDTLVLDCGVLHHALHVHSTDSMQMPSMRLGRAPSTPPPPERAQVGTALDCDA